MNNFVKDPSGSLPAYRITPKVYSIGIAEQGYYTIEFRRPVFKDSLEIRRIDGTDAVFLTETTDWVVNTIDWTSMAETAAESTGFNKTLITSIDVYSKDVVFKISVVYQSLYPIKMGDYLISGDNVDLNPGLISELASRVTSVENVAAALATEIGVTTATPKLLEEDPRMILERNHITGEVHTINALNNVRMIRPACGAFYIDNLVVRRVGITTPLVYGHDYDVFGMDVARTIKTTNKKGVFRYIRVLSEVIGDVEIEYRGYGGEVTYDDMVILSDRVFDITTYLSGNMFLTDKTLTNSLVIRTIQDAIVAVRDEMRNLVTTGQASYADMTDGKSVKLALMSTTTGFNWYTIAKLYQISGNSEVFTADRFRFRMKLVNAGIMADVIASLNENSASNNFDVSVLSYNGPVGYLFGSDYSGLANLNRIQARVIYNKTTGSASGAYLQIGLNMPTLSEVLGIEDQSGKESAWILLDPVSSGNSPANTAVALPNNSYVWDEYNPASVQYARPIAPKEGWLAHSGTLPLTHENHGREVELASVIQTSLKLTSVKKVKVQLTDIDGQWLEGTSIFDQTSGAAVVSVTLSDLTSVSFKITPHTVSGSNLYNLAVLPSTSSILGSIVLRHIFFEV